MSRDERVLVPRDPVLHLRRRADAATAASPTRSSTSPRSLVGHVRGGLGMSNVIACTLFGGISGSPVADVSAMGSVMIPMMKKEGYDADYAVNVTTHASLVGALTPTSHNMIIYSLAAGGQGVDRRADPRRRRADDRARDLHAGRRVLGRRAPRLSARHLARLECGCALGGSRALPGLFVAVIIIVGHPVRRLHGDRVGVDRGALRDAHHVRRLSHDVVGELPQGERRRR